MARRDSLLARWLEPLASTLWYFFLVWTALVAAVWVGGISADHIAEEVDLPADVSTIMALKNYLAMREIGRAHV